MRLAYFNKSKAKLSKRARCDLLGINRNRIYYVPIPKSEANQILEDKIYSIWDDHNFKGSRIIKAELHENEGLQVNRKKVQRIMGELGIHGILPKSNLSKPGDLQYKHPYYLAGMTIYMANMAWGTDITYVNLPTGKMYVICLLDIFSRYIVGYVVTNTLETSGCLECLDKALYKHGAPEILNSDQGSQFTSHAWVTALEANNIAISMDSKGRWVDNVYVERFWRTLKYECIFALGIETVEQLHLEVAKYIIYYNKRRLHSALGYKTPESIYLASKAKHEKFVAYCKWPADEERTRLGWKTVRPTVTNGVSLN